MKKIEDIIGMPYIKCNNKNGNENLKKIHYKINDTIFKYSKRYAFKYYLNELQLELISLFKDLNNLDIPNNALLKKNELLQIGRDIVKKIKQELKNNDMSNLNKAITESLNYNMYQYIKNKDNLNNINIDTLINMLDNNKSLLNAINDYTKDNTVNIDLSDATKYKIDNLIKLQSQLVDYIHNRLMSEYVN